MPTVANLWVCVHRRASSSPADEFTQNLRKRRSQVEQELVALAAETDPSVLRYKLVRLLLCTPLLLLPPIPSQPQSS